MNIILKLLRKSSIIFKIVKDKVIKSEYINGVLEFIRDIPNMPKFICTGTPETKLWILFNKEIYIHILLIFMAHQN